MNAAYIHIILDRKANLDAMVWSVQVFICFFFHCEENVLLMTGSEMNFVVVIFLTEATERANMPLRGKTGGQSTS